MATYVLTTRAPRRETLCSAPEIGRRRLMSAFSGAAFAGAALAIAAPAASIIPAIENPIVCRDQTELDLLTFFRKLTSEQQQSFLALMRRCAEVQS